MKAPTVDAKEYVPSVDTIIKEKVPKYEFNHTSATVKMVNKIPTMWDLNIDNDKKTVVMKIKSKYKVKPFKDRMEVVGNVINSYLALYNDFDLILMDPKAEYDDVTARMRLSYDSYELPLIEKFRDSDMRVLSEIAGVMQRGSRERKPNLINDPFSGTLSIEERRNFSLPGMREDIDLMRTFNDYNWVFFIGTVNFREYLALFGNANTTLASQNSGELYPLEKIYWRGSNLSVRFMNEMLNNNVSLCFAFFEYHRNRIKNTITFGERSITTVFKELTNKLRLKSGQAGSSNDLPSRLTSTNGMAAQYTITTIATFNLRTRIEMHFDSIIEFDVEKILGIINMWLYDLPCYYTKRTLIRCWNYLYNCLIARVLGSNSRVLSDLEMDAVPIVVNPTGAGVNARIRNYITAVNNFMRGMADNGRFIGNMAEYRYQNFQYASAVADLHLGPLITDTPTNQPPQSDNITEKWTQLQLLAISMIGITWIGVGSDKGPSLCAILNMMTESSNNIQMYCYSYQNLLRIQQLSPLSHTTHDIENGVILITDVTWSGQASRHLMIDFGMGINGLSNLDFVKKEWSLMSAIGKDMQTIRDVQVLVEAMVTATGIRIPVSWKFEMITKHVNLLAKDYWSILFNGMDFFFFIYNIIAGISVESVPGALVRDYITNVRQADFGWGRYPTFRATAMLATTYWRFNTFNDYAIGLRPQLTNVNPANNAIIPAFNARTYTYSWDLLKENYLNSTLYINAVANQVWDVFFTYEDNDMVNVEVDIAKVALKGVTIVPSGYRVINKVYRDDHAAYYLPPFFSTNLPDFRFYWRDSVGGNARNFQTFVASLAQDRMTFFKVYTFDLMNLTEAY